MMYICIPSYFCCTENIPVISLNDLKDIAIDQNNSSLRSEKISKLKDKIDSIVETGHWDFDDIFQEHNYCNVSSTVFECIVYFLTGYVIINSYTFKTEISI